MEEITMKQADIIDDLEREIFQLATTQVDIMDDFERDIFWKAQEENRALTREEIDMINKHYLEKKNAIATSNPTQTK